MVGGSGNDTLSSSGDNGHQFSGGGGNATMTSDGRHGVTLFGGTGNDTLSSTGGTSVTLIGGTGNDTSVQRQSAQSNVLIIGGSGNSVMTQTGGTSITTGVPITGVGSRGRRPCDHRRQTELATQREHHHLDHAPDRSRVLPNGVQQFRTE